MLQGFPVALYPLPSCLPNLRLPGPQEPGDGRTKGNGCGSGSGGGRSPPASKAAFLQLSAAVRIGHAICYCFFCELQSKVGTERPKAKEARAWPLPKGTAGLGTLGQKLPGGERREGSRWQATDPPAHSLLPICAPGVPSTAASGPERRDGGPGSGDQTQGSSRFPRLWRKSTGKGPGRRDQQAHGGVGWGGVKWLKPIHPMSPLSIIVSCCQSSGTVLTTLCSLLPTPPNPQ